jgi:hypothetical protein
MRRAFLVVAFVLGGCAFEPAGGVANGGGDGTDAAATADTDGAQATDEDAAPDFDADPSTTPDALVSLDAGLPLPDAAAPADASPAVDAGQPIDAPSGPTTENACTNGNDDDHDGDVDCRDSDCPGCSGLSSCCASGACALICL